MGKFTTYLFIICGFLLVFYFLGLSDSGASSGLLDLLLSPENIRSQEKIALVLTLFSSLVVGVSALLTRAYSPDIVIMAVLAPVLLEFGFELLQIINMIRNVSTVLAVLVFSPLLFVYVFTVLEWWRGVTT